MSNDDTIDTLPCGKKVISNEGKLYVVSSDTNDICGLGMRQVILIEQYCGACRKLASLKENLNNINDPDERLNVEKSIQKMSELFGPDHIGPFNNCNIKLSSVSVDSFEKSRAINEYDDIQDMANLVQKYGFPSIVLFLSFYANTSKLGLEWMELLFKEISMQSERLKNTPDLDKENPLYDKVMDAIKITDMGVTPVNNTKNTESNEDDRMFC